MNMKLDSFSVFFGMSLGFILGIFTTFNYPLFFSNFNPVPTSTQITHFIDSIPKLIAHLLFFTLFISFFIQLLYPIFNSILSKLHKTPNTSHTLRNTVDNENVCVNEERMKSVELKQNENSLNENSVYKARLENKLHNQLKSTPHALKHKHYLITTGNKLGSTPLNTQNAHESTENTECVTENSEIGKKSSENGTRSGEIVRKSSDIVGNSGAFGVSARGKLNRKENEEREECLRRGREERLRREEEKIEKKLEEGRKMLQRRKDIDEKYNGMLEERERVRNECENVKELTWKCEMKVRRLKDQMALGGHVELMEELEKDMETVEEYRKQLDQYESRLDEIETEMAQLKAEQ
eukprot:CAMPEP_0182446500 /NCGR_PEP_ID=MMETSP1172-20130603/4246_1 /TAXON_ID=708627 /ORGANISM="Timspurckia oligopyrenoides, Strain CCMP3278" /LENGTH=351 /DNA_ID=CAMNT_0024642441 /DNA_START=1 /DNA_END=1056 /DNA_ORIENTATION=+